MDRAAEELLARWPRRRRTQRTCWSWGRRPPMARPGDPPATSRCSPTRSLWPWRRSTELPTASCAERSGRRSWSQMGPGRLETAASEAIAVARMGEEPPGLAPPSWPRSRAALAAPPRCWRHRGGRELLDGRGRIREADWGLARTLPSAIAPAPPLRPTALVRVPNPCARAQRSLREAPMASHHPVRRAAVRELVAALRASADAMAAAGESLQRAVPPEAAPEPAPPWVVGHLLHTEGMRIVAAADALVPRLLVAAAELPGGDRRLQQAWRERGADVLLGQGPSGKGTTLVVARHGRLVRRAWPGEATRRLHCVWHAPDGDVWRVFNAYAPPHARGHAGDDEARPCLVEAYCRCADDCRRRLQLRVGRPPVRSCVRSSRVAGRLGPWAVGPCRPAARSQSA